MKTEHRNPPSPPKQSRSRATLERILTAAEALLEEQLFEELSIARIAAEAEVSVGTIYTRFPSKEALLPVLFERHNAAVEGLVAALIERLGRIGSLRTRIETIVDFAVSYHRQRRGVLRALTMYVRSHPESVPAQLFRERAGQYRAIARIVAGGDRRRTDPLVEAVEFGLSVVDSVCREQLLFAEVAPLRVRRRSLADLRRRLTETVFRYLEHV